MIFLQKNYKNPVLTVDSIIIVKSSGSGNADNCNYNNAITNINTNTNINANSNTNSNSNSNNDLAIVLIKRKYDPYKGCWAIPGGFVEYGETVEEAAVRESKEETGITIDILGLFGVYSKPNRDPRFHTVTIVFIANGSTDNMCASDDAEEIASFSHDEIKNMELAFDHNSILNDFFNTNNFN